MKPWGGTERAAGTSSPSTVSGSEGVQVEAEAGSLNQGDRGWTEEAEGTGVEQHTATPRPEGEAETRGVEESAETAAEIASPCRLVGPPPPPPLVSPTVSVSEKVVPLLETSEGIAATGVETPVSSLRSAVEQTDPAVAGTAAAAVSAALAAAVEAGEDEVGSSEIDVASVRENRVPSSETPPEAYEGGTEKPAALTMSPSSREGVSDVAVPDSAAHQANRDDEGVAVAARPPPAAAAAAAAAGAVPLVGNGARGKKFESLAGGGQVCDRRGGEAVGSAADLAAAATEEE
ncbi:unnamed protein product, partial [Laminaria digitata]